MLTVCCLQCGDKYDDRYVLNLMRQVEKWLKTPFRFRVLTDRPERWADAAIPLRGGLRGWWNKLYLFSPEVFPFKERVLYLDLDVVVVGPLDRFVLFDSPWVCHRDFMRPREAATAVMAFDAGTVADVWRKFCQDPGRWADTFWGDQEFIDAFFTPDFFPRHWVRSYRLEALGGPSEGCSVVCFHGKPKPHECQGWVKDYWDAEIR